MNSRDKAIAELRKQMAEAKARLGPEKMRELEALAKRMNPPSASAPAEKDSVPYDRKTATKAIELFLQGHENPGRLKTLLLALLKKTEK